jgi:hypothetical protein
VAQTDVPAQPVDVILARPTDTAVTLSVLAYLDEEGQVSYGTDKDQLTRRTPLAQFPNGEPVEIVLDSLQPNTRYHYQLALETTDSSRRVEGTFHTRRSRGHPFVFTVQADSHLDQNTSPDVYVNTVRNALADNPDFHIDLGDTFMTGKYQGDNPTELYLAQRYYFGRLCHSAPLLFTLGNHDGEPGSRGRPRTEAVLLRKKYFPNPVPDDFYTGNRREEPGIGLLQDYYAWEWGDALFVVLDPFWFTARQQGGGRDNWHRTLGEAQYRWLQATLISTPNRISTGSSISSCRNPDTIGTEVPARRGSTAIETGRSWPVPVICAFPSRRRRPLLTISYACFRKTSEATKQMQRLRTRTRFLRFRQRATIRHRGEPNVRIDEIGQ